MIRRRVLVPALALAPAAAQAQARPARVGFLHPRLPALVEPLRLAAVREGLAEAARSNRPVEIVARVADGSAERLRAYAGELAGARLDAIVAVSLPGVAAARDATRTTPIVAVDLETDPVAAGWVASLAKPGGNVTGLFFDVADFAAKCLQILAETVPRVSRVGVLWDPSTGGNQRGAESTAARVGVVLDLRPARTLAEVEAAVRALAASGAGALLVLSSPLFGTNTDAIAALASAARLPAIMAFPDFARHGGLVAYGPDFQDLFRRAGAMARRIVDGARAGEVPVERPVRFNLVLNLRTARVLGLDLSPLLLAHADEVVE